MKESRHTSYVYHYGTIVVCAQREENKTTAVVLFSLSSFAPITMFQTFSRSVETLRDKTRIELFFTRDRAKPGVEPIKWDIKRKHTYQKLGSKTKEIHCQEYGTIFVFIMSSWKN